MRLLIYLLFTVCVVNCISIQNGDVKGPEEFSLRLPNHTIPINYDLYVITDIHQGVFDFNGRVVIYVNVLEETNSIMLHSYLLSLNDLSVYNHDGFVFNTSFEMNADTHQVRIDSLEPFEANQELFIDIFYSGNLRTDDVGFYRSSYYDENNNLV